MTRATAPTAIDIRIALQQVADPDAQRSIHEPPRYPEATREITPEMGLKHLLDTKGPEAFSKWVLEQKKLLITDTTMRDAHQSLLSTRMRTRDMVKGAEGMADVLNDCFSLEMWGGATFDTAYRFLYESPWERLRLLREKIPNIPFQMLLRGSNLVGYASYPDNVVRAFVAESARCGIDVFRVFDSLNWIPSMEVAMDEVLKQGKLLEATVCYTGDILDPTRDKYTPQVLCRLCQGARAPRHPHHLHQGHVRPAQALCRQRAGQGAQAGGRRPDSPAQPQHHRQPDCRLHDGRRGRRGYRRLRHCATVEPHQPALAQLACRGAARTGARHRA